MFMFKPDIINKICINDVIKENNYIFCNMIITYPCDAGMKFMGAWHHNPFNFCFNPYCED